MYTIWIKDGYGITLKSKSLKLSGMTDLLKKMRLFRQIYFLYWKIRYYSMCEYYNKDFVGEPPQSVWG